MQSHDLITFKDLILVPLYFSIIIFLAYIIQRKDKSKYAEKYLVRGLAIKLFGVIIFCLIYVFYYKGGDTVNYFIGAKSIGNLLLDPSLFHKGFAILFNTDSVHNSINSFTTETGYPRMYMWNDENSMSVCRFTVLFSILGSGSFLCTSLFTAGYSYIGVWKLYKMFNIEFPKNSKALAYLILFLPSIVFWGGGVMKDSYVLCATCWVTYNFYRIFIIRKKLIINLILLLINLAIIINTKSYVIISLLPGMLLWLNNSYLKEKVNTNLGRFLFFPVLLVFISIFGYLIFLNLSSFMGVYGDVDSAIQQAQIIQDDLLREDQYGSNNYNIGELDGSIIGLVRIAPAAIFTALFRPLFWEVGSPTMAISVIENSILFLFSMRILFFTNPISLIKVLFVNPVLLYSVVFSLLFAFGVGIAGTNFGALVRYKIPLMPFFFSSVYLIHQIYKSKS